MIPEEQPQTNYQPLELPLNIVSGAGGSILQNGVLKSPNYQPGISGWIIDSNGKLHAKESNLVLFEAVVDAAGNGDYLDLQSALNAGKKRIFVRSGDYSITTPITITADDVKIVGEGWQNTCFRSNEAIGATNVFEIGFENDPYKNIEISDIGINTTPSAGGSGFFAHSGVSFLTINNCHVYGCYTSGITFQGVDISTISNCFIEFSHSYGIVFQNASNSTISNNSIGYNNNAGIYLYGAAQQNNISGNTIYANDNYQINIEGSFFNLINNNLIDGRLAAGDTISVMNAAHNNIISGNAIIQAGHNGINLQGVKRNTIVGNTFDYNSGSTNNTYSHIFLQDDDSLNHCLRNVINGNTMKDTGANKTKYGVRENDANQDKNIVTCNVVTDSVTDQISLQGANSINANNIVT